jgi:corrinoid protein of di/trimethylamine methyltransferase
MHQLYEQARKAIVEADQDQVKVVVEQAFAENIEAGDLLEHGFVPGISEIGERFENEEIFLPELIMSADAMKLAADLCNKAVTGTPAASKGIVVLGTVMGDVHDIGKSIVESFLSASGFTVHDLGRDVSSEAFINKAIEVNADVIATSALLTTTIRAQADLETILTEKSLKGKIKTIVGGAPTSQVWADKIGADGYAEDAPGAVRLLTELLG